MTRGPKAIVIAVIVAVLRLPAYGDTVTLYSNTFQGAVGPEWSPNTVSTTPRGARKFLGQASSASPVNLTLTGLPIGGPVTVSFDLFVIFDWRGNTGPDTWRWSVENGPTLLYTTFNTFGGTQAYPDSYPGGSHPPFTGASEVNTLGYGVSGGEWDAVYHLVATFSPTDTTTVLNFVSSVHGSGRKWGIDNITVEAEAFLLVAPGNGGFCKPSCRFQWLPAEQVADLARYALVVDGAIRKDNIPPGTTDYTTTVLEQLDEGPHAWTMQACDTEGSCEQSPETFTVNIDGTPPAGFALVLPGNDAWQSRLAGFTFQWAPTSDGASATPSGLDHYDIVVDGQVRATVPANQSTIASNNSGLHPILSDGDHSWTVTAVDLAGNGTTAIERTVRMDSTAPNFPAFAPVPSNNSYTTDRTPTVQWQLASDAGSGVASQRVVLDSGMQFDPGVSATSFTFPMNLADGPHQWRIDTSDLAGNSTSSTTFAFNVDTTPPNGLRLTSTPVGTADGAIISSLTPQLCWSPPTDAGSGLTGFRLYINGALARNNIAPASQCTTPSTGLSDGHYQWYVEAFDALGNTAPSLETYTFSVDTQPPTPFMLLSPLDQSMLAEARPSFAWTASIDAGAGLDHYEVSIDSGAGGVCPSPCMVPAAQTAFIPAHDLGVGSHSWFVTAVDKAGRHTQAGPHTFDVAATPTPTATATHSSTPTATITATPSASATPTLTGTPSATATATATGTDTATPTPTPTPSSTATPTVTATQTSTSTATATATPVDTATPTATVTETATASPIPTPTQTPVPTTTSSASPTPTPTSTPSPASCGGDCNGGGSVSVDELVKGVNIALGLQPVDTCPAFANAQHVVDIAQLVTGVRNALNGCGSP